MKILPSTLLATLIALASVAGAVMYSQKAAKTNAANPKLTKEKKALEKQIEILKGENETLKAIQLNGARISLPIAHYKFVEENLALTFPKHVNAKRVDNSRMLEAVSDRYAKQFGKEGMNMREYAFTNLGIMPPNQALLNQLAIAEASGAVALYDPSINEILLSPSFDEQNTTHSVSVIKHLAIALLELNYPLSDTEKLNLTDDAYFAREGFIRGRASSIAQRYRNIRALRSGSSKQYQTNPKAVETFNALPILVKGITTFPNIHGKTYIEDILLKNNKVFPEIYKQMPRSTATIYARKMPTKKPLETADPNAPIVHLKTQLGQLFVTLYLKQLGKDHSEIHRKLNSDQLTISELDREYTVTWNTQWNTEQAAKTFHKLATELSSIPDQKPNVTIHKKQVILKISKLHSN